MEENKFIINRNRFPINDNKAPTRDPSLSLFLSVCVEWEGWGGMKSQMNTS